MIKRIASILFLLLFLQSISAINVVFRLDDPRLRYDSVSMRVVKLFNEKQVPLSVAVVPCNKQEQPILPKTMVDSLYISELQHKNIELALHGFNHQDINNQGEFGGLSYDEAVRKIRIGGGILRDCTSQKVSTFIPPFNAFNYATLEAMKDNGLFILSADMFTNIYRDGIQYYPETLGHLMAKKGIWQAAEDAIFGCKEKNAIGVVMFHAYDLPDEASWQRLENLLDACKADKNVELHTFQSLYESGNTSSQYRYKANQLHSLLQKHLLHPGVLHTTWLCWLVHVLNALMYALVVWVMFLFIRLILRKWDKRLLLTTAIISLVFFLLPILQIGSPMKLLAVDVLLSGVVLVVALIVKKRK